MKMNVTYLGWWSMALIPNWNIGTYKSFDKEMIRIINLCACINVNRKNQRCYRMSFAVQQTCQNTARTIETRKGFWTKNFRIGLYTFPSSKYRTCPLLWQYLNMCQVSLHAIFQLPIMFGTWDIYPPHAMKIRICSTYHKTIQARQYS